MRHAKFAFGLLGVLFLLTGGIPTARAATVDLATLYADYTATNGTTLTGTLSDNYKISIADGATITLNGAIIRGTNSANFQWAGLTCEGDATIVLSGENTIKGFYSSYPGIHIPSGKTLTIRGDGTLDARDNGNGTGIGGGYGIACGNIFIEGGTITATGGFGAGIGGGYDAPCGEIRITGGIVTATGGNGSAGIGGGYNPDGSTNGLCGDITITGGTVTATGGDNGAGIGGGNKVPCGNINLSAGIIRATGGKNAAGVGGSWMASCGDIIIMGGTVTAKGGDNGAGIGGGNKASCGDIGLTGGIIRATGGKNAAGIGSGCLSSCGDITIEFGIDTLSATMGDSATPIGNGCEGTCGTISIADNLTDMTRGPTRRLTSWDGYLAAVTHDIVALDGMTLSGTLTGNYKISIADGATVTLEGVTIVGNDNYGCWWAGISCEGDVTIILSGANTIKGFYNGYSGIFVPKNKTLTIRGSGSLTAQGVGGGCGIGGGSIIIEDGEITATGGNRAAGICGSIIIITGGDITATGGDYSAGIEGNRIAIKGGKITAIGGAFAAGIGASMGSSCGDILIEGGMINSIAGSSAAGIGAGISGSCGDIIITDGTIIATGGDAGAGIGGSGDATPCGIISITGGTILATGGNYAAGIGGGQNGSCSNITIGADITRVTATKGNANPTPIGRGVNSTCGTVTIEEGLEQIRSDDGVTLTVQPRHDHTITWLDDAGFEIDTTEVADGTVPIHAEPVSTRTAEAPYRYVFTGWTPEPAVVTNDATYTATFVRVADLALLNGDWSPADGDILLPGETPYAVVISAGVTVSVDGIAFSADGVSSSTPVFADGGSALITGFAPADGGIWTLEAYGDLANGTAEGVTADMVQVYAADTVEGLATAAPLSSGVTLKEAQNAVKTTLEVTPPTASDTQFFRVQFATE